MIYCIYHIPGKKIGVTNDLKNRVEKQQGYEEDEYEVLEMSEDIDYISKRELELQEKYGYKIDMKPYKDLYKPINNKNMNINVTEQTTTFPHPVNKLKGHLVENLGMEWDTEFGEVFLTHESISWIMKNVKTSMYNNNRSYIYNKAFSRYFDNHDAHSIRTGGLFPVGADHRLEKEVKKPGTYISHFDLIRDWAEKRGLYDKGDPKTQTLKLMEEAGEICRAVLKDKRDDVIDGIGDCVVVLTNLAKLAGTTIEDCIEVAYNEIKDRTGKMDNGTFKKD